MTQALNLANFANNLNTSGATTNAGLQNSAVTVTAGTAMSGGGAVSLGGSVTLNNAGVTSLVAGTGISVSGATGAVTVSVSGGGGVTSLNGQTGAVVTTDVDAIGSICHVAYTGTSQIAVGSTVAGSSLSRASSATDQLTSNGTYWSQGTNAGSRPKTTWGNTIGEGQGVAIQETTGNVGYQAPGGATTMSGTWRLLSPVVGRASELIAPCCVNTTRSRSWCCIAVRVS
jgi:hypothetical protein